MALGDCACVLSEVLHRCCELGRADSRLKRTAVLTVCLVHRRRKSIAAEEQIELARQAAGREAVGSFIASRCADASYRDIKCTRVLLCLTMAWARAVTHRIW